MMTTSFKFDAVPVACRTLDEIIDDKLRDAEHKGLVFETIYTFASCNFSLDF